MAEWKARSCCCYPQYEQSLASYRKGVEIADKYLGPTHAITVTLRNSSIAAKRAIVNRDPKAKSKEGSTTGRAERPGRCPLISTTAD